MKKLLLCFAAATLGIATQGSAQYLTQDFEGVTPPALPSSYTNTVTGLGNGWQTANAAHTIYASAGIGIPAHTKYAFVDDQAAHSNAPAKLKTSTFDLSSATGTVFLKYDYWFPQYSLTSTGRREIAWVEFSTDNGSTWSTVDSFEAMGGWTTRGIALPSTSSSTCNLRFCYSDNRNTSSTDSAGIIGVGLDNIQVLTPPTAEIALTAMSPVDGDPSSDYAIVSSGSFTFTGQVYNNGASTVSSFDWGYKMGSGAWVTGTASGLSIAPFNSGTFACTAAPCTTAGQSAVSMYVRLTGDADYSNDTLGTNVYGVASFPTKVPLFEEPTGTWCGFCVRGIVYMDSIWRAHSGAVSVISVHNSDPMQAANSSTVAYDNLISSKVGGYPGLVLDRMIDAQDPANAFSAYNAASTWYGFAGMTQTHVTTSSTITINTTVTPTMNLSGDYRLELVLTEDRVHGTTSGYDQHNYYNSHSYGHLQNTEYDFWTLPATIPAASMYYDFVARTTIPADLETNPNGVAGSLPATMTAGTPYTYSFAPVTYTSAWNCNKMRAVVILIDNNSSSATYGYALNSVNSVTYLGVSDVKAGLMGLRIFPNPAQNNAEIMFDNQDAGNITVSVVDVAGRTLFTQSQNMNAGEQHVNVNVADLNTGIYNVIISNEKGSITERLSIAK